MDRDALVEAMARALCLEKYQHPVDRDLWDRMQEGVRDRWLALARAALAVAEPVIQAAEREACAEMAERFGSYSIPVAIRARTSPT